MDFSEYMRQVRAARGARPYACALRCGSTICSSLPSTRMQGSSCARLAFGSRFSLDRKSTRLNSSHRCISYAVFCLKKKNTAEPRLQPLFELAQLLDRRGAQRLVDRAVAVVRRTLPDLTGETRLERIVVRLVAGAGL